jgi:hypothetical protein
MGSWRIDSKAWPLVHFIAEGELTQAQLNDHLRDHRAILDRNEPYAIVIDATAMGSTDAFLRKRYAEFIATNGATLKRLCKGAAVVLNSSLTRGVITAVMWMTTVPFPHKVFGDRAEAIAWAKQQIDPG